MNKINNKIYLGLGSNLGDSINLLKEATENINLLSQTKINKYAPLYLTKPVGSVEQADFYNSVILVESALKPHQLLAKLQEIENKMGRKREIHWGPRTIDIDILLYNQQEINTKDLKIPHPHMQERAFVLAPLLDIAPDLNIPKQGNIRKIWQQLSKEEKNNIKKLHNMWY